MEEKLKEIPAVSLGKSCWNFPADAFDRYVGTVAARHKSLRLADGIVKEEGTTKNNRINKGPRWHTVGFLIDCVRCPRLQLGLVDPAILSPSKVCPVWNYTLEKYTIIESAEANSSPFPCWLESIFIA